MTEKKTRKSVKGQAVLFKEDGKYLLNVGIFKTLSAAKAGAIVLAATSGDDETYCTALLYPSFKVKVTEETTVKAEIIQDAQ